MTVEITARWAAVSEDGLYRYSLTRAWVPMGRVDRGRVCFMLCNPSTADGEVDDPTVRKGVGFAERWGYSSLEFINRGAFRATDPKALLAAADPVGPLNVEYWWMALERADLLVCAWGRAWPTRLDRLSRVPNVPAVCLGRNADGSPRHPLMLAYSTAVEFWGA